MRPLVFFALLLGAAIPRGGRAQTADDLNEGFRLVKDASTDVGTLSW